MGPMRMMAAMAALGAAAHPVRAGDALLDVLGDFAMLDDAVPARRRLRALDGAITYSFEAFGDVHEVELTLARGLLAPGAAHVKVHADGSETVEPLETDCIFRSVDAARQGVFSFCGDMVHGRVMTADGADTLHIQPLPSNSDKHVAFRGRDLLEKQNGVCGITEDNEEQYDAFLTSNPGGVKNAGSGSSDPGAPAQRRRQQTTREVEMVVVNDFERYSALGNRAQVNAAYIVGLVAAQYESLGGDYPIKIVLSQIYTFTEANPWTYPVVNNGLSIDVNAALRLTSEWAEGRLPGAGTDQVPGRMEQYDLLHLLAGSDFYEPENSNDAVVGLAWVDGWCVDDQNSSDGIKVKQVGVTQATYSSAQYTANIMSHEVGHNLGMRHTNVKLPGTSTTCFDSKSPHIMDAISTNAEAKPTWSSCARSWVKFAIEEEESGDCTINPASKVWSAPQCGNGIVEEGEDCDCLLRDCTDDPCCTADCTFASGAICSAKDPCCTDECSIEPAASNRVCRPSGDSVCDPDPETCDGTSARCPVDNVADTGTPCPNSGACYFGNCVSRDTQCQALGYPGECPFKLDECDGSLKCAPPGSEDKRPNEISSCAVVSGYGYLDGTPCDGVKKLCSQGACVSDLSQLPTPEDALECSDGIKNGKESDVDCGGQTCLPCIGGQACGVDTDCAYPGVCNITGATGVCVDSGEGSGVRDPEDGDDDDSLPFPDSVEEAKELWDKITAWVIENQTASIGIGVGTLLFCVLCCCGGAAKQRRQPPPRRFKPRSAGAPLAAAER